MRNVLAVISCLSMLFMISGCAKSYPPPQSDSSALVIGKLVVRGTGWTSWSSGVTIKEVTADGTEKSHFTSSDSSGIFAIANVPRSSSYYIERFKLYYLSYDAGTFETKRKSGSSANQNRQIQYVGDLTITLGQTMSTSTSFKWKHSVGSDLDDEVIEKAFMSDRFSAWYDVFLDEKQARK